MITRPLSRTTLLATAAVSLGVLAGAPGARAADAPAIVAGKALAMNGGGGAPPCSACHGAAGEGQAASGIPRLAGLDAGYLRAQLAAFAAGSRENATMGGIAKAMDAEGMDNVAAYYASLPAPSVSVAPARADAAKVTTGAMLADRGDWAAHVPPCSSCHGKDGRGVGAAFPAIAGQSAPYIVGQIKAWKVGSRHDDPLGLMHAVASRLTDEQVAAVADYYAALSGAAAPRQESAR